MKMLYLVAIVVGLSAATTANSTTFYENNAHTINSPFGCLAIKSSAIFSIPRKTYHALVIESAHWSVTYFSKVKNEHLLSDVKFETDKIEVSDETGEGYDIKKIVMSTDFATSECRGNAYRELEKKKRLEEEC